MALGKYDFSIGDRVKHPKFGEGDVLDVYPFHDETVVVVSFEKLGQKKILLKYGKLELVKKEEEPDEADESDS